MALFKTADITVNTSTTGTQSNSTVTQLADGKYVITWSSVNGGTEEIRAQIFNADGSASGAEMLVTTASDVGVASTAITALQEGGFAIVWQQGLNTTQDVYFRAYDADGVALGGTTSAALMTAAQASTKEWAPAVATIGAGVVIAAWSTDAGDILFRPFAIDTSTTSSTQGQLIPVATETTISGAGVAGGVPVEIAALTDGRFVVQWINSVSNNVAAMMFTAAGTTDGVAITVNTAATATDSKIDALANGGWISTYTAGGNLYAQRFTDAGLKDGTEMTVSNLSGTQTDADVAQLADGRIAIVWASNENGSNYDIHMRMYSSTGTAIGEDFIVHTSTTGEQTKPSVQALTDGRFLVSWTNSPASDADIQSTIFDPSNYTGTSAANTWSGGDASDRLYGLDGGDTLSGNDGADFIQGGNGNDILNGGLGNDIIYGDTGTDTIVGSDGNDKLYGGADVDNINGGTGNDIVEGGAGINGSTGDTLNGGGGLDTVSYYHSVLGVTVNLLTNTFTGGDAQGDIVTKFSFDNVMGSVSANDSLTGDDLNNVLWGYGGVDTINGGKGNDTLYGGDGNDSLTGGDGGDIIYGGTGNDNVTAGLGNDVMYGGSGNDNYNGGAGLDTLSFYNELTGVTFSLDGTLTAAGGATGDTITTTAGNETENLYGSNVGDDTLRGNALANIMRGYIGNDTINGVDGNDNLQGGDGNDTVSGGVGLDTIDGGNGDDTLNGNGDVDTITGGNGADTITGGAGIDKLNGGAGNDTFIWNFTSEFGDVMTGFDKGVVTSGALSAGDVFKFNSANILGLGSYDAAADFVVNATGLAVDSADRFIWNTTNDQLMYDRDGSGTTYSAQLVADFNTTYTMIGLQIVII